MNRFSDPFDDPRPSPRPIMEAQVMELQSRFDDYQKPRCDMKPGDFVVERDGLGIMRQDNGPVAMMLWRILDPEHNYFDREIIADAVSETRAINIDCLVGYIDDGCLKGLGHDTRRLQKAEG